MSPSSLPALLLLLTAYRLSEAFPVPPSHRFTVYTPYWTQNPRSVPATDRVDCLVNLCADKVRGHYADNLPYVQTPGKRSKNVYKSGWTMGGMPFSVLYMNPKGQISARSPMTESLRAYPPAFDNSEALLQRQALLQRDAAPVDNIAPDAQALSSGTGNPSPTSIPTRRQYSIIPQLFVSYGWGPLGKRDD